MQRVAKFEKVSLKEFKNAVGVNYPETVIEEMWNAIKLPIRATKGSAGYDFYLPHERLLLLAGESALIPTGIRVSIEEGWFLACVPKSGLGFKYRIQLDNTIGVIDSDYYFSDNEGHIKAKITNDGKEDKSIDLRKGDAFIQGIFIPFGCTVDDSATGIRNGGFGSTAS